MDYLHFAPTMDRPKCGATWTCIVKQYRGERLRLPRARDIVGEHPREMERDAAQNQRFF